MTRTTLSQAAIEAAIARARQERAAAFSAILLRGLRGLRRAAAGLGAGRQPQARPVRA